MVIARALRKLSLQGSPTEYSLVQVLPNNSRLAWKHKGGVGNYVLGVPSLNLSWRQIIMEVEG